MVTKRYISTLHNNPPSRYNITSSVKRLSYLIHRGEKMFNLVESELKKQENYSITENGAVGYKSTNSAIVDLHFKLSSLRNSNEEEIIELFDKAFYEDKKYTLKFLFFARDIREGLGERRFFRICYKRLTELDIDLFYKNLHNIAEYGRWDDLISLIGINSVIDSHLAVIMMAQLNKDKANISKGEPISLLGKWLPSENASSKKTKALSKKVRKLLQMSPREYRLMLSELRAYLKVVEVEMCSNKWKTIDYERVPSMANLKYNDSFLRHDENRRREYLNSVRKGSKKMNMGVATPVDIISKYTTLRGRVPEYEESLELAWKNLKNINIENTLVVADGSGSMTVRVSGGTTALSVANALAIYTAEHNDGVYKDKYITFSNTPRFVDLSEAKNLQEKLNICREHHEIANTNIEAVFKLILGVAVANNISKEDMIKNILIISDMEFDSAQRNCFRRNNSMLTRPLFENIKETYKAMGYDLPKLIFWNVNSRTNTIPLTENELGVVLVSGFSQNVLKMVMSDKYDPYEVLIETLDSERYDDIIV